MKESAKTNASRQAKHRASGKAIGLTLTDPAAIKILETLKSKLSSYKAAIEHALRQVKK